MGGDKGLEAGRLCFCLLMGRLGTPCVGEKTNHKKPMERKAASMRLIGLARRMDRAIAMMEECGLHDRGGLLGELWSARRPFGRPSVLYPLTVEMESNYIPSDRRQPRGHKGSSKVEDMVVGERDGHQLASVATVHLAMINSKTLLSESMHRKGPSLLVITLVLIRDF